MLLSLATDPLLYSLGEIGTLEAGGVQVISLAPADLVLLSDSWDHTGIISDMYLNACGDRDSFKLKMYWCGRSLTQSLTSL